MLTSSLASRHCLADIPRTSLDKLAFGFVSFCVDCLCSQMTVTRRTLDLSASTETTTSSSSLAPVVSQLLHAKVSDTAVKVFSRGGTAT